MRVMVINPPRVKGFPVVREERFEHKDMGSVHPPLSLLYTAAVVEREGYEVRFVDANGFDLPLASVRESIKEYSPDVVISRTAFDTQEEDLKVLASAKEVSSAVTVLRNKIISEVPRMREQVLQRDEVDIFLNQEPESVIISLLRALDDGSKNLTAVKGISFKQDGQTITAEPAERLRHLDSLPFPAYHLLPNLNVYETGMMPAPWTIVMTSRGCPFHCTFCAYRETGHRVRSPENVVSELEWLASEFGIKHFQFFDDTISLIPGRIEQICELMLKRGLRLEWSACTRANLVTKEMLQQIKKAGCVELAIGIESGAAQILREVRKGITLDDIRNAARFCHQVGIRVYGLVIIGLPGETKETFSETINLILELDTFYTQFCFAVPFPNTPMYEYYRQNNLLLTEDWGAYFPLASNPVVRTEHLSASELIRLRRRAYVRTLLRPRYLLSKISLNNWKWNCRGIMKLWERMLATMKNEPVR